MRLGIRRKLIGTLMLVGLLPLALSLAVLLVGGATMRLHSIHSAYEHKATDSANQLAAIVIHEMEKLEIIARLPQVQLYALEQTETHAARRKVSATAPALTIPDEFSRQLDTRWAALQSGDEPLRGILQNPLADRLGTLTALDTHPRQCLATDAFGELIAADAKTGDYFQGDEDWWQAAYDGGRGRPYVSSVTINPATGTEVVAVAVPIYDDSGQRLVGIIKDKIDVAWFQDPLREVTTELEGASALLFDAAAGHIAVRGTGGHPEDAKRTEEAFILHGPNHQETLLGAMLGDLVIGSAPVPLDRRLPAHLSNAVVPHWVVLISKRAQEAMTPVYRLAVTVAAIGIALILVLFILGVAISNREIILPILRLREATAAVGRNELNIRLVSEQDKESTFRADELGDLARDFDEMTRELQKNLGKLERSNEAKLRFMELAGHELKTPVTYIIGVCQLAQRQLQEAQKVLQNQGSENTATLVRHEGAVNASLVKIAAKAQRLSRIVDNLLKLVQNDQFTTRLVKQPIDMRALILQVCNDARPFITERNQQLNCDVAENLPALEGDRDKLEDALTNLLSNAIRFSPDGSTIKVAAHVLVGDMLEILVEDAGPGIPAGDAANLFEPFYTGTDIMHHHSGTIEYGSKGLGLGLAIVRRFVEIHGGVVKAHPLPGGKGTQFQILLPVTGREGQASLVAGEAKPAAAAEMGAESS